MTRYRCELCGKRAVAGQHFCRPQDVARHRHRHRDLDTDLAPGAEGREEKRFNPLGWVWASTPWIGAVILAIVVLDPQLNPGLWDVLGALPPVVWFVVAGGAAALALLVGVSRRRADRFGQLVGLCGGDRKTAARLAAAEAGPGVSRAEAVDRAVDRLLRARLR